MIHTRYNLSLAVAGTALMLTPQQLLAQEQDILPERQVTITRDYVPEASTIIKMDCQPTVEKPDTTHRDATFSTTELTAAQQRGFGVMPVQQVIATPDPYNRGWVRADMGNYLTGNLDASARHAGFQLDLKAHSFSSDQMRWYDNAQEIFGSKSYATKDPVQPYKEVSLLPGERWDRALMLNGEIRLGYDYTFLNDARLHAYVGARGQIHDMPGSKLYSTEEDPNTLLTDNDYTRQRTDAIDAGVSYATDVWRVSAAYTRTGVHYPDIANQDYKLHGEYGWYEGEQWKFKAGMDLAFQYDNQDLRTTLMAKGEISYLPNRTQLNRYYANVCFGSERPVLYDMIAENPLYLPLDHRTDIRIKDANNNVFLIDPLETPWRYECTLGYESNELGNFHWGLYAGVRLNWNEVTTIMMVHPLSQLSIVDIDPVLGRPVTPEGKHIGPFARAVNHDCYEFPMGLTMDLEVSRYFAASVVAQAKPRVCDFAESGKEDARLSCDIHLKSNPLKALSVDLSFVGRFLRRGVYSTNFNEPRHIDDRHTVNLHNITDFNLDASYQWMDNLSFYGSVRNMLCQRYELWPGIPAQRLNFHLGFQYRF